AVPGDPGSLHHKGKAAADTPQNREISHIAYTGSVMPPPEAVKSGKVKPLSTEDRYTLVRWIDLGCPIDLEYDPRKPEAVGGWLCDDQRPTLALTAPRVGANKELTRVLVGMHDYGSGLDKESFAVTADFPVDGARPGDNLAASFKDRGEG